MGRPWQQLLAVGLTLLVAPAGRAQEVPQPPQPPPAPARPNVNKLAHEMAQRVRHLGEDIASDLAESPQGKHLLEDTKELADAVDAFHESLHDARDPRVVGKTFAGIDETWRHLKLQLARPGVSSPAVARAAARVDEVDAQLRGALGLAAPVQGIPPDLNRIVHEMAERVRHLGEDIASDLGTNPQGKHLLEDTRELAGAVDAFHESLHDLRDPNEIRRAYRGIDDTWHHLKSQLLRPGVSSPGVGRAAARVDELDARIHQALGIGGGPVPAPVPPNAPQPPPPGAWTGPREVSRAARRFAQAAEGLKDAIEDVSEESPLVAQAHRLAEAAEHFGEAVRRGAPFERAVRDFQKLEANYRLTEEALKRDHDVHHDEHVGADAKRLRAAYERLVAEMSGRRVP